MKILLVLVGFLLQSSIAFVGNLVGHPIHQPFTRSSSSSTHLSMAWNDLEIEEDEEPQWYILNCLVGQEILLRQQCASRCKDMEGAVQFVVPTSTTTRSHQPQKILKMDQPKYPGYVFANVRLYGQTYNAIQSLDLCRSFMGTRRMAGKRVLPPLPVPLNEDEVARFQLDNDIHALSTTPKTPDGNETIAKELVQVYNGIRVDDHVIVTAENEFHDEPGIVRRLKDGRISVILYSYGVEFDKWMEPSDVRKQTAMEKEQGVQLRPPMPGNRKGEKPRFGNKNPRRNRRQDRNIERFRQDDRRHGMDDEENWDWFKDRRQQGL